MRRILLFGGLGAVGVLLLVFTLFVGIVIGGSGVDDSDSALEQREAKTSPRALGERKEERLMYARVSTAEVQPGKIDEVIDISKDSILPAAREQQGFKGGLWLTNRDTNKVMVVTLWESREEMESGETGGYYREQIGKLAGLLAGDVVRDAYEVSIRE